MPHATWKILFAEVGLPVERTNYFSQVPILTWSLMALNVLIFVFSTQEWTRPFGFIPADAFRYFGPTGVSSMFLHGSLWHLVGNVYFLFLFGDNVEARLGHKVFLSLCIACGLGARLLQFLSNPRSPVPMIGASGAISGLIVFYALSFPKAKIHQLFYSRWFSMPAILCAALWMLVQLLHVALESSRVFGVAYHAHVGGAFMGLGVWYFLKSEPPTEWASVRVRKL